jgi:DNA modification methylase
VDAAEVLLAKRLCVEGGVVLDTMAASGTTQAAASRMGRRHLDIEIDEAVVAKHYSA